MKKKIWLSGLLLVILLFAGTYYANATTEAKKVDVMFLHDTHSHLNSFTTLEDGKEKVLGGFAKIKTLIHEQKEKNPEKLLLDGGDFSMGTLIQVMYEEEAS